jgi:hypothetical protein
MANHGYVSTNRRLTGDKLHGLLQEINRDRFDGKLKITREEHGWDGKPTFEVEIADGLGRLFWLTSPGKIEHRHGPGGDFFWWVEFTIANELALRLKGTLSDEGVDNKWKGEPGWCPTFRSYLENNVRDKPLPIRVALLGFQLEELREARKMRPDLKKQILGHD